MCIQLNGTGAGAGGNPVTGTYTVFVNNLCPECEFGHLDFAKPGDGSWDIEWCVGREGGMDGGREGWRRVLVLHGRWSMFSHILIIQYNNRKAIPCDVGHHNMRFVFMVRLHLSLSSSSSLPSFHPALRQLLVSS